MEELRFIAGVLLVVILVCFVIFMVGSLAFVAYMAIDNWRWKHRSK